MTRAKHPAILHTKSSNKIYLWLEGRTYAADFSGKLAIFFAIKEVYTKSFFLLIALVENLNANNMNLLAAAAGIDVMTCRNKEWSFELFRTQNTSILGFWRSPLVSLNYNQFIKMSYSSKLKKNIGLSFFNFDSFGFSLFAFRFSTKAVGKNINFVCFFNSERE